MNLEAFFLYSPPPAFICWQFHGVVVSARGGPYMGRVGWSAFASHLNHNVAEVGIQFLENQSRFQWGQLRPQRGRAELSLWRCLTVCNKVSTSKYKKGRPRRLVEGCPSKAEANRSFPMTLSNLKEGTQKYWP